MNKNLFTVREAIREAIIEEMRMDPDVFLMGEEVGEYNGAYGISRGLINEFGSKRIIDAPLSESGFTGLGIGAAFSGLKPIIEFMTFSFSMQAIDHIINSAAKILYMSGGEITCPIVFRGPNGPSFRTGAQHSQCFASWYSHCPGLKVIAPYSASDFKGLLKASIRDPNPIIFLENEILYGFSFPRSDLNEVVVPIGKAKIICDGDDVTILAFSFMVHLSLEAAKLLSNDRIYSEVIDLRTIRPIDYDTIITSVKKTNRLILIEQGWPYAGISSEISAVIMEKVFYFLDAPVLRITGADVPMPYANNLMKLSIPSVDQIVEAARYVCHK